MNLGSLILLALAAAVYPTLLAGVILILTQPRPLRMLLGFLAGGMGISVAAGLLIVGALESSGAISESSHSTQPIVSIVVGAVSLLLAWAVATGRVERTFQRHKRPGRRLASPARPSITTRALSHGSVTMAFAAGLVLNLPGIWYLDALTEIAKAQPSTVSTLLQILLFNVIMFGLVEFPIVAYLLDPDGATARVQSLSSSIHARSRQIAVWVATAVGVWLIVKGIIDL